MTGKRTMCATHSPGTESLGVPQKSSLFLVVAVTATGGKSMESLGIAKKSTWFFVMAAT